MKQVRVVMLSLLMVLLCGLFSQAQQSVAMATDVMVPPLVNFSGVLSDVNGKPLTGIVGVTFYLYKEQQGDAPLWLETQNVQPNSAGHYTVMLGSATSHGIPANIFASGEAHWLGVQVQGQAEQPRVLLVSAPYALKAGDAETLGGLPPSAFMLATPQNGAASSSITASATGQTAPPPSSPITGAGTVNYLPLWDSASDIISSVLFQKGTGSTAKIGINTAAPATMLDVKGASTIRGTLSLPATGAATATAGKNSQPLNLAASAFNSTSSTVVNQTFQWQAEPAGNDTSTPSGTLNLLFGSGTTKPSETGLNIASNGVISFATGQTFPNVTGNETVSGNISSGGSVNATTSFDIGGTPFAFGAVANGNALLGFAGNSTMTGKFNLADGYQALASNTTGSSNTADGYQTLASNTTGSNNTALGYKANVGAGNLTNATAIGANSTVTESNALVLGSIQGMAGATASTNVGIGTTAPAYLLEVNSPSATVAQMAMVSGGTDAAISVNNTASGGHDYWIDSGSGSAGIGPGNFAIYDHTVFAPRLVVNSSGLVGIGTTTPGAVLDVDGVNQSDVFIKAPESSVGSGLDFFTTGTGGLQWEILDTGSGAAQGANKLNIRNATAGTDVLTILASGNVGIGTTAPQYTLDVHGTGNFTGNVTFTGNQTVNGAFAASSSAFGVTGAATATSGLAVGVGGTAASPSGYGVEGVNTAGGGTGVYGYDSAGVGVSGSGGTGVSGSGTNYGLNGTATGSGNTVGVFGSGFYGVYGSGTNYGIVAKATGADSIGVIGQVGSGSGYNRLGSTAVWGDAGGASEASWAVLGTAADNVAGAFYNDSESVLTLSALNNSTNGDAVVFEAYGPSFKAGCIVDIQGDLTCSGSKSAVVPVDGGSRKVALYAIEGPENWFEDAGSAHLSNGEAIVNLEEVFGQTVNTETEYHVFLTPKGDCKGLYVAQESPTSFEVHELGGGTSSIAFDYRIMAKRKGYESVRLADKTKLFSEQEAHLSKMRRPVQPSAAPGTRPATQTPQLKPALQPLAAQPK